MAGAVANPAMKATVDKHFDLFMRSYAPAEIEKETLTAEQLEEYEARAKEYSKMKMAQHRAWQKDIAGKIRHKLVAIKSLPEGFIRDAAAAPDYSSFSMKRTRPSLTPAIPGFYEAKQEKADKKDRQRLANMFAKSAAAAAGGVKRNRPSEAKQPEAGAMDADDLLESILAGVGGDDAPNVPARISCFAPDDVDARPGLTQDDPRRAFFVLLPPTPPLPPYSSLPSTLTHPLTLSARQITSHAHSSLHTSVSCPRPPPTAAGSSPLPLLDRSCTQAPSTLPQRLSP